jgi:predicted transposase/invertase (TIGR01784 family)
MTQHTTQHLVRFDWALKNLLGKKANFCVLEGFLSELLNRQVKILSVLESKRNKLEESGKYSKLDVSVEFEDHEVAIIEVQINNDPNYLFSMLRDASLMVVDYVEEGGLYARVKNVYLINILYCESDDGDYIYHGSNSFSGLHEHARSGTEQQSDAFPKFNVFQICPEYYLIKTANFKDLPKDRTDEWVYFLKNGEIKDAFTAQGLSEAKEKLDELKLSKSDKQAYKHYLDNFSSG